LISYVDNCVGMFFKGGGNKCQSRKINIVNFQFETMPAKEARKTYKSRSKSPKRTPKRAPKGEKTRTRRIPSVEKGTVTNKFGRTVSKAKSSLGKKSPNNVYLKAWNQARKTIFDAGELKLPKNYDSLPLGEKMKITSKRSHPENYRKIRKEYERILASKNIKASRPRSPKKSSRSSM
jgi:hypothetical protein